MDNLSDHIASDKKHCDDQDSKSWMECGDHVDDSTTPPRISDPHQSEDVRSSNRKSAPITRDLNLETKTSTSPSHV